jgi:hypothetical protein
MSWNSFSDDASPLDFRNVNPISQFFEASLPFAQAAFRTPVILDRVASVVRETQNDLFGAIDFLDARQLKQDAPQLEKEGAELRPGIKQRVEGYRNALEEQYRLIFNCEPVENVESIQKSPRPGRGAACAVNTDATRVIRLGRTERNKRNDEFDRTTSPSVFAKKNC